MTTNFCSSVLMVKSIPASREFYQQLLGQDIKFDHGECIIFAGGFSIWQIDHAEKILGHRLSEGTTGKPSGPFELYFESGELDHLYITCQNHKIRFVHEMIEQP